jgi:protein-disulfide isomerase
MASRTKQKEAARARRIAEERARLERERRQRRLRTVSGTMLAAVAVVAVAIAVSSAGGGGGTGILKGAAARRAAVTVSRLLTGIPQSGATVGSPSAKVTVTEFGDLECPICADFARGAETELIAKDVRNGKVKLLYRSFPTATGNGPDPGIFPTQQAAALAAGEQGKAWNYIMLFYREQGAEGTAYVNDKYLTAIARQIPGLDIAKWQSARQSSALAAQVSQDEQAALAKSFDSTPSLIVSGPKGQAQPLIGNTDYGSLEKEIQSVS